MKNLFRIIELEQHQVLLAKDFDNESEPDNDLIIMTFHIDGIKCSQTFAYSNSEIRDRMFLEITDLQVEKTVENALKMFS